MANETPCAELSKLPTDFVFCYRRFKQITKLQIHDCSLDYSPTKLRKLMMTGGLHDPDASILQYWTLFYPTEQIREIWAPPINFMPLVNMKVRFFFYLALVVDNLSSIGKFFKFLSNCPRFMPSQLSSSSQRLSSAYYIGLKQPWTSLAGKARKWPGKERHFFACGRHQEGKKQSPFHREGIYISLKN